MIYNLVIKLVSLIFYSKRFFILFSGCFIYVYEIQPLEPQVLRQYLIFVKVVLLKTNCSLDH